MGCVGSAAEHVLGGGRGVILNNFSKRRYLKKHSTLPLCYSLSAADKKMVTSTMKKMVGPEAE